MARFAIATDAHVGKSGWGKRIDRVAQKTILTRWNMVDGFPFNGVSGSGESTVMTTFATSFNAGMVERSPYKTIGSMARAAIILCRYVSTSRFVGSEFAVTILTVTYNVGVNVSKKS